MSKFKENLRDLKYIYNVYTNKELALKLGITDEAIRNWTRIQSIPKKYVEIIEQHKNESLIDFNKTTTEENKEDIKTLNDFNKMMAETINKDIAIEKINEILKKLNNEDLLKIMKSLWNIKN